jgi:probable phosphoglycerate mutase
MTESKAGGAIVAYCDGGSRGNPGPSGYGVFVQTATGETLGELSEFLGVKTNNVAEYSGLLAALGFALEHGHPHLRVVSDSELMVKQMKGQYRVNSPDLKPLYEEAKRRAGQLQRFEIQHVLRGKNKEADRLANEAMDRGAAGGMARGTASGGAGRPLIATQRPEGRGAASGAGSASGTGPAGGAGPAGREALSHAGASAGRTALGSTSAQSSARSSSEPSSQPSLQINLRPEPGPGPQPKLPLGASELPREVTGFVKNGVVHLVEGELPEGTFVRILPARR